MSLNRPVYVPPHKRKRFHGAFTGGYSAGYFNTVGSKEGWKPRDDTTIKYGEQSAEDFMDDQDFNEWGGPQSVKKEFVTNYDDKVTKETSNPINLTQMPSNVGTRLLRVLGWREGSTAYVPYTSEQTEHEVDKNNTLAMILSQKCLRRIKLSQKIVNIPPPKHDFGGLGFELYREAPEFQAHREKRRRDAHQRSRAAVSSTSGSNIYRLSSVVDEQRKEDINEKYAIDHNADSYETMQDFIGTKTSAGFSIREDDDDVYDDHVLQKDTSLKSQIDKDSYETEIYEHRSDDDDNDQKAATFGGVLSSWIGIDKKKSDLDESNGMTADGRPLLRGFRLGSSITRAEMIRYPGPDIPSDFTLKMHSFEEDESPESLLKISARETTKRLRQESLQNAIDPMAGGAFSSLATAMKNRFTSASQEHEENDNVMPVGLHRPIAYTVVKQQETEPTKRPNQIKIERNFMLFYPDSLLCKRFNVKPPFSHGNNNHPEHARKTKADYFEKEILKHAEAAANSNKETTTKSIKEIINSEDYQPDMKDTDQRPSLEVYKSIYDLQSESDSDNEKLESITKPDKNHLPNESDALALTLHNTEAQANETKLKSNSPRSKEKKHHQKKHKRRKISSKRKRIKDYSSSASCESDNGSSSSEDTERRRRKKKRRRRSRKRRIIVNAENDIETPSYEEEHKGRRRKERKKKRRKEPH